jgi:hypothetical protein
MTTSDSAAESTRSVRVIGVFATRWRYPGYGQNQNVPDFEMGRLAEFYTLYRDQLPQVLAHEVVDVSTLTFIPEADDVDITWAEDVDVTFAEARLFALPSDQVVAALTLDFQTADVRHDQDTTVKILELFAYADVGIDREPLATYIARLARREGAEAIIDDSVTELLETAGPTGTTEPATAKAIPAKGAPTDADTLDGGKLPPERHQIVVVDRPLDEGGYDDNVVKQMVKRILFRIDHPYREGFVAEKRPAGLNQEQSRLGAVTPYVSLIYGHEEYVANSVLLTVVQAIGTAARFRQIWRDAYHHVRTFRSTTQKAEVGQQRRADLEDLVDRLGNLELDLSFSVETSADLGLLIPSLRIESYHRDLYKVMELPARARTVSRMFARLDSSIRSELTAIEIRERREEERKRLRGAVAASLLGFVLAPLGFLMAFFGINAVQVNSQFSLFDWRHYWAAYVVAAAIAVLPLIVFVALYGWSWFVDRRRDRRRSRRRGAWLPVTVPVGPDSRGVRPVPVSIHKGHKEQPLPGGVDGEPDEPVSPDVEA